MTAAAERKTLEFKDGNFLLGGEPFFCYSGEIHYFRIPKGQWKSRLKALKAAGFNAVSTYIPWIWHEPEEGRRDFTGKTLPERDVLGFFDLARREGLYVLARVGPVSNAELLHEGVPDWLIKAYPDVFVTGGRDVGNLPHVTILSYLHPVFQAKVDAWYSALIPAVAERQVTRGGNVLGVQLCNEVAMVHWLQKGADYKDHVNRQYRAFLREIYGDIAALNGTYGTSYAGFDAVPQPKVEAVDPGKLQVRMDWALFYRRYYAAYFLSLASRARARGIDVPLYCNIPQFYDYDIRGRGNWAPMTTSMFRDFPLLVPGLVFGGAYQMRHLDFENFHDVALTTEITRLLSAVKVKSPVPSFRPSAVELPALPEFETVAEAETPVVCAELQTGIMRDRPRLYPQQVELNVKTSVSQGLAGLNAYMFAGGVNPDGLGAFGTYHDWQSPIGPEGEKRPHLEPLARFGRFLKWAGPLLARTRKAVDTALGFYLPYYATEYWDGPWTQNLESQRTNLFYDGLARLVHLAGYSCRFVDLQRAPLDVLLRLPGLWVYSLDFMDAGTQSKLAAYVKAGGKLVLGPRLPSVGLMGEKRTELADGLGLSVAGELPGNRYRSGGADYWVQGPIQLFRSADGAGQEWREGAPNGHEPLVSLEQGMAAVKKSVGRGEVVLAGFGLPHVFDHFRDWVKSWGASLGLVPRVACDPWDVQAVLREGEDFGFLFLFNYHFTAREAVVSLALPGSGGKIRLPGRGRLTLAPLSGAVLPLNLPLAPGVRLTYATAEALDLRADAKGLKAVFSAIPGREVEVALSLPRKPRSAKSGAKPATITWKPGRATILFHAEKPETPLAVVF